ILGRSAATRRAAAQRPELRSGQRSRSEPASHRQFVEDQILAPLPCGRRSAGLPLTEKSIMTETLLAAISFDSIPPDVWTAIISAALTLAVSAAHARGRKLPLLEWILDAVLVTNTKSASGDPASVLNELLSELKALRAARQAGSGVPSP